MIITNKQLHRSVCLQQENTIKKPQIMLRTVPNFSNSTNRVPAHSLRHHTSDFYCKVNTTHRSLLLQLACCGEALTSQLPSAVEFRSSRMKMIITPWK